MRDVLIIGIVAYGCLLALRRPWIGVMLWTWLSVMSPHRYAYGFAYDAPLAAVAAVCTLLGLLMASDQRGSPWKGAPVVLFAMLTVWITASWLLGLDTEGDYGQWNKVMKVNFMLLVSLALLHSKQHIFGLVWVAAGSLALLGAKGGLFTVISGGSYRVWGPEGSFIEDNNEFALALVMTIPLLRFLQMQMSNGLARHGMTLLMLLVAAAALGSHSRGGLLAISAMSLVLWWRGRNRGVGGVVIILAAMGLVAFMPQEWSDRMNSISDYEQDNSTLGRFSACWVAFGVAKSHFFGAGFNLARPDLFALHSPYFAELGGTHAAHSIYFQILGNHGFIGLALFFSVGVTTYWWAARIRREAREILEARWCVDLAGMCQVAMVGYGVGGAFLSLAYFDLPYIIMVLVVLTRVWVSSRAWEREPVYAPGWRTLPGLVLAKQAR